jgi:hypothetical protein
VNPHNVAALTEILKYKVDMFRYKAGLDSLEEIAAHLAAQGVLAPRALLPGVEHSSLWRNNTHASLVSFLERLARGEV